MTDLEIRRRRITHPDAVTLVEEVQAEYVVRYGGRDDTPLDADAFEPPRGAFYVGYLDGLPVASAAWRATDVVRLGERAVEVKRMYVVPAARRRGVAVRMLERLEAAAREQGADHVVLETGLRQPEAIALYLAHGYEPVEKFGHYAAYDSSRCYARRIAPPEPSNRL